MAFSFDWWIFLAVALLSAGLALALIPLARKIDLVDHPGHRRVHDAPTALTGGPGIFAALALFLVLRQAHDPFAQALLVGGGLIFITGLLDDRRDLSHITRFVLQVTACLVMVYWGGVYLEDFGKLFTNHTLLLGPLYVPITIFSCMGVINAFNMIDGMDGLSGGVFLVAAAGMAVFAGFAGAFYLYGVLLAAVAAVFGFMLLNARFPWNAKARVFLGDSGSTLLGFVLGWCFIALGNDFNETGQRAFMPMTAVWLFAVPLVDTTTLMYRRWRSGKSAFRADQQHLHHAFLRAGFTTGQTWLGIVALAVVFALVGAAFELSSLPDYIGFWTFLALAYAYLFYMRRTWTIQRFLGRDFIYNDFEEHEP